MKKTKTFPSTGKWMAARLDYSPRSDLVEQAFKWLDRWEVIVPSRPYNELALDFTERSKEMPKDLRLMLPDPRVFFFKTSKRVVRLWECYQEHLTKDYDERIAFLLAIWQEKPYYKLLPAGRWIE